METAVPAIPGLDRAARDLLDEGAATAARVEAAATWVAGRGGDPAVLRTWVARLTDGLAPLAAAVADGTDPAVAIGKPAGLVEILESSAEAAFGPLPFLPGSPVGTDFMAAFARRARRFGLIASMRPGAPFPRWATLGRALDAPGSWEAGALVLVAYALDPGRIALVDAEGYRTLVGSEVALGAPDPAALAAL